MYGPECSSTELRIFNAMSSRVQLLAAASVEALHLGPSVESSCVEHDVPRRGPPARDDCTVLVDVRPRK